MATWEYKEISNPTEEELNTLGREGWELVSVDTNDVGVTTAYLKRRKE